MVAINGKCVLRVNGRDRQPRNNVQGWIEAIFKHDVHRLLEFLQAARAGESKGDIHPAIGQQALVNAPQTHMAFEGSDDFKVVIELELLFVNVRLEGCPHWRFHELCDVKDHGTFPFHKVSYNCYKISYGVRIMVLSSPLALAHYRQAARGCQALRYYTATLAHQLCLWQAMPGAGWAGGLAVTGLRPPAYHPMAPSRPVVAPGFRGRARCSESCDQCRFRCSSYARAMPAA